MPMRHLRLSGLIAGFLTAAAGVCGQDPQRGPAAAMPEPPLQVNIAEAIRLCPERRIVKVRGIVTGTNAPGSFYMQDDTGRIRGQLIHTLDMKAGDVLDVTGRAEIWQTSPARRRAGIPGFPYLQNASAVRIQSAPLPNPISLNPGDAFASAEVHAS